MELWGRGGLSNGCQVCRGVRESRGEGKEIDQRNKERAFGEDGGEGKGPCGIAGVLVI